MTFAKKVILMCDCEGCENCRHDQEKAGLCSEMYDSDQPTATEARNEAMSAGWGNYSTEDYCPGCDDHR